MSLVASRAAPELGIEPRARNGFWLISLLLVCGLACFIAAGRLLQSAALAAQPWAWDYAEPIVYGQAARVIQGQTLYQTVGTPPLTVTAYTPLYYVAAGALQALFGSGLWTGRALSYASGLVSAACVWGLTYAEVRNRRAALTAAAIFLGLGFSGSVPWFALYRVDTLGLAFSLAAVYVVCCRPRRRMLVFAGVLAGLGLLTKQSFFAAPLAGTLWLAQRSKRDAVAYGVTALLAAGVPCLLLAVSQPAFLENTVVANVNPIAPLQVGFLWSPLERSVGPTAVLAVLYVLPISRRRWSANTSLIVLYWAFSAVSLLGLLKFGAFYNYWIEFAAATAVLAVSSLWKIPESYRDPMWRLISGVLVWMLIFDLAWVAGNFVVGVPGSAESLQDETRRTQFAQLVERVRDEPGPVLAEPMDVVTLAGRQLVLEPVIFGILQRQGTWDPQPLVHSICSGEVRLLVLEMPLQSLAEYAPFGMPWWPEPVVRALQGRMMNSDVLAGRIIYTPRPQLNSVGPNVCR